MTRTLSAPPPPRIGAGKQERAEGARKKPPEKERSAPLYDNSMNSMIVVVVSVEQVVPLMVDCVLNVMCLVSTHSVGAVA